MSYSVVVMVMYTVLASLHDGILPGGEIGFHSSEPHVMVYYVIASLLLDLHESNYITLYDLDSDEGAEAEARTKTNEMLEAYSSRPTVVAAGFTKEWVADFFVKKSSTTATAGDVGDGDESD